MNSQQTENKLDFSRPIQTRDGRKVRILCTDKKGASPVVGLIERNPGEEEMTFHWQLTGLHYEGSCRRPEDLINVPERIERDVWVNLNGKVLGHIYDTRKEADDMAVQDRTECVKIHISCLKGEGLDAR